MAVEAVVADIYSSADKPLGVGFLPIQHFGPRRKPMQAFGLFSPESFRVGFGLVPDLFVFSQALESSLGGEISRRRKLPIFLEDAGNVCGGRGHSRILHGQASETTETIDYQNYAAETSKGSNRVM